MINDWADQAATTEVGTQALAIGNHSLVVEYYQHLGSAVAVFSYTAPAVSCPAGQWLAQYYNGTALAGPVVASQCEAAINYNWGTGSPAGIAVGPTNFSVRWSQTLSVPTAGTYSFTTTSDDGIRVSVDGSYVINDWNDHAPTTDVGTQALAIGNHSLVVEYYQHLVSATAVFSYAAP